MSAGPGTGTPQGAAGSEGPASPASPPDPYEPARHILRRLTVERFLSRPHDPAGAIPAAVRHVVGGPAMWSENPVREIQFTAQQRDLVMRASQEIHELYASAGGIPEPRMEHDDALGLMPENSNQFEYQSEEWAAAKAITAGRAVPVDRHLPLPDQRQSELARAYYEVITWIDYVKDGLLDASAVYEDDEEEEEDPQAPPAESAQHRREHPAPGFRLS